MRKEEIDVLLERYYKGLSTEEDERLLRSIFKKGDIPEEYAAEKAIFSYLSSVSDFQEPSTDFEQKIISAIDSISLTGSSSVIKIVPVLSGIAAGLILLIGSWFLFTRNQPEDTYSDPEIAYVQTMKILYEVSSLMNTGTSELEPVSKMNLKDVKGLDVLTRSKETMEKNLENLEYIEKVIRLTDVSEKKEEK